MNNPLIYCDGSCWPNPGGNGGWAFRIVVDGKVKWENSGGVPAPQTNQTMELMAAIKGLETFLGQVPGIGRTTVEVRSDSSYLINCFRQGWYRKWQVNGWRNSNKQPVSNRLLWERLIALNSNPLLFITWIHVKGHVGVEHNEACDGAAEAARKSLDACTPR